MSVPRTPPKIFSSDSDLYLSANKMSDDINIPRKRKQIDLEMINFEEKFDSQMKLWNKNITDCITNSIAAAVTTALTGELSKITSALSELNNSVIKLNADTVNLNTSLNEVNSRLCEMDKSLHFAHERQDEFESRLKILEHKISENDGNKIQIQQLENKICFMEQQARQCNVEISNVPDKRDENLINIVERLGTAIKTSIRSSDIISVHRVPHADQNDRRPKNIIVKFANRILRDNVVAACRRNKSLNSSDLSMPGQAVAIYVNEHLTLNNKLLFRQSKEVAKKYGYKFVWIKHGTVLVRKVEGQPTFAIRSISDISKIK